MKQFVRAKLTLKDVEDDLNEIGVPESEKKSNGGLIPDHAKYGSWLRRNDPTAFYYAKDDLENCYGKWEEV